MSQETDCAKRAVRIKALRAKADSTEFPDERDTLNEKADELEARNNELGYVDEPVKRTSFNDAWEQFFGAEWKAQQAEQQLKRYQAHIRRQEAKKAQNDCDHEWVDLFSPTHGQMRHCEKCGKDQVTAPGGYADSYEEFFVDDIKAHHPPPTQRRRSSHAECYANGLHVNTKAGRASCRRSHG